MTRPDDPIREEALTWAVRAGDLSFADWDGLTAWLEANPAHSAAYAAITAAVADAGQALQLAANDDAPAAPPRWTRRWLGGAVAAALVGALVFSLWGGPGGGERFETAPGETMLVTLDDGSTITLAGGTSLELPAGADREARLLAGEALFTIVHNDADPFVLIAGEQRLVDAGTVFDVRLGQRGLTLAVAEGAVIYDPQGAGVMVRPGQLLTSGAGAGEIVLGTIAPEQVGEWQDGRLTFELAPLETVAEDLTRATGIAFTARAASADYAVSGSLLTGPVEADPRSLAALLNVAVRPVGGGWELAER